MAGDNTVERLLEDVSPKTPSLGMIKHIIVYTTFFIAYTEDSPNVPTASVKRLRTVSARLSDEACKYTGILIW